MTFVLSGLQRSGNLLLRRDLMQKGNVHALQALFPLRRRLLPVRGLLRKSRTPDLLGMHLVLCPVGLPLLPLDLGPVRGVEVPLVACPVRASALLSPLLLRELRRGELLVRSGCPLPALLPQLPLPTHHCTLCEVVSWESLRRSAPVRDPSVFPDPWIEEQGRIVQPALSRAALVAGLVDLALAPLPVRGQAVESVVGGTRLGRCPPASGCGVTGHGLLTAIGHVAFVLACCLGETGRSPRTATGLAGIALDVTGCDLLITTGLGRSVRDPLLVGEVAVIARCHAIPLAALLTARGHAIPLAALLTARGHGCGRLSPLTVRGRRIEAGKPDVSNGRVWRQWLSPRLPLSQKHRPQWLLLLWGGAVAALPSAVQDLARFFLSLTGSSSQGAVDSVAGASVPASGVGVQLCLLAPGGGAGSSWAAIATSSLAARPPSASAAVPGSTGRRHHEEELSARVGVAVARPVVVPAEQARDVLRNAPLPLVAFLAAGRSPIDLLALLKKIEPSLLLPPLDLCMEVHLAIPVPLRRATSRLVLALRAGGFGLPL